MTKAVVAKGKKRTESKETLKPPNSPTSILGCWVINHTHQAKKVGKYVEVTGKFDINVWYSHNDHSKTSVFTETIPYKDRIRLHYRDEPTSGMKRLSSMLFNIQIVQKQLFQSVGKSSLFAVERELVAEVVGETKVCVSVHPHTFEEEWPVP